MSPATSEKLDLLAVMRSDSPVNGRDLVVLSVAAKTHEHGASVDATKTAFDNNSGAQFSSLVGVDARVKTAVLRRTRALVELHVCLPHGTYTSKGVKGEHIASCSVRVWPATATEPAKVQCFIDGTSFSALLTAVEPRGDYEDGHPIPLLWWLRQAQYLAGTDRK